MAPFPVGKKLKNNDFKTLSRDRRQTPPTYQPQMNSTDGIEGDENFLPQVTTADIPTVAVRIKKPTEFVNLLTVSIYHHKSEAACSDCAPPPDGAKLVKTRTGRFLNKIC